MEEIDFNEQETAYDRLLELANCVDEKQNLLDNDFDLETLFDSTFDQLKLVTSKVGCAVRLNKIVEKYRTQYEERNKHLANSTNSSDERAEVIKERLNKKRFIPVYLLDLHVPDMIKDVDKRRIFTDLANFINKYTTTVRRGELDGLCAYAIAKYPQLNEQQWSGYEIMKMRVLSILKNRRNTKRKREPDDFDE